jgi:hypothetical protein
MRTKTLEKLESNFQRTVLFGDINLEDFEIHSTLNGTYISGCSYLSFHNFESTKYLGSSKHPKTRAEYHHFSCALNGETLVVNAIKK